MAPDDQDSKIQTGGTSVQGGVNTGGGDLVSRDKYVQYIQLDLQKLLETLKLSLPAGDPLPQHLVQTLKGFQHYHTRLHDWKELHNSLNDVLYALGQFSREVERLDAVRQTPDPRALSRLWRPVAHKVALLIDWSSSVRSIAEVPFKRLGGEMQGPSWAVEIQAASSRLDDLLNGGTIEFNDLYDATFDFLDTTERHMYLADKQLRETAEELYDLSRIVLGSMSHDEE